MKTAIITGITGQDGAYLSRYLMKKGYRVVGLVRRVNPSALKGLGYLGVASKVIIEKCDLLSRTAINKMLRKYKPKEIYNLAAQSSVELSFHQPRDTIRFNLMSVVNLLETVKAVDKTIKFYQASTSEMYGRVEDLPVRETAAMHPLSPYGISKAAAHWATVNFREAFGLFACCGILFNHESFLHKDTFFVKKVVKESIEIAQRKRKVLRVGNIDIARDFGYAPEYVKAMWLMLQFNQPGDYVICSEVSISLRSIIRHVFKRLSISEKALVVDRNLYRPTEILDIQGDCKKAKTILKWHYHLDFYDVLDMLIEEENQK